MCTNVRPKVSKKNDYYISKERYYELKHFCLQYNDWMKALIALDTMNFNGNIPEFITSNKYKSSPVERIIIAREYYRERIQMINDTAREADDEICEFIVMNVTKDISCVALINVHGMPCGRDKFYKAYRKFFWLLSQKRN